jgi:hypothetical protein
VLVNYILYCSFKHSLRIFFILARAVFLSVFLSIFLSHSLTLAQDLPLSLSVALTLSLSQRHKNINVLKIGHFLGFFEGADSQDNLGVKKVSAPSKNHLKCPIICFAREKNNRLHFQNQRYIKS